MKNIAILMGGFSSECEISIKSGKVITRAMDLSKFNCYPLYILEEGWFYERNNHKYHIDKNDFSLDIDGEKITFDCCYNTIHGDPGENGILQAYLELLEIPQTSCNSYVSAVTFNKRDCLAVLRPWDIATGIHIYLNEGDRISFDEIAERLNTPFFVKANRSGSSFGVSKVYKEEEFQEALENAFAVDNQIIIESFLDGMEVSVGVFEVNGKITTLPPTEIVTENDFFDYEAKYEGKSQEITPARLDKKQIAVLQEITSKVYRVLNAKGIARADFIYQNGAPHFIEINTNPGMSEESIVPQQIKAAGLSLQEVITDIITDTIKRTT